MDIEYQ